MKWEFEDGTTFNIADYPDAFGFIYRIEYDNGQIYLGKKDMFTKVVLPKNRNRKKKEVFYRESLSWKQYEGSTKLSKGLTVKRKVVLYVANTRRALTYLETKVLFKYDAIFNEKCLNKNIGGLYFDNVFEPLKEPIKKEYR